MCSSFEAVSLRPGVTETTGMDETSEPGFVTRAIWQPAWHRLDQSLKIGQAGRFWFFAKPPASKGGRDTAVDGSDLVKKSGANLQFFNRTVSARNAPEVRSGTVVSIVHPQLGPLQSVDTSGLDYRFVTAAGAEFSVNAEEETGTVFDAPELKVGDWSVEVLLHGLSEPLADLA
jgi:hypothetical protein